MNHTLFRRIALLVLLIFFPLFASAQTIAFDGVMYQKLSEDFSSAIKVIEYVPENETAANWTKKLSFRQFPHLDDARTAGALLDNSLKQDPANTVDLSISRKDKDEALVSYQHKPQNATNPELNMVRYLKQEGVEGLVSYQFTYRGEDAPNADKERWLNALARSQWPLKEVFTKK
jgi:hypothetical protein